MFALGESAERILALMESLLSSPPDDAPSVQAMFANLEHFLGSTGSTRLELKGRLLNLTSQALRLSNFDLNYDIRLVDFLKYVRRQQKANGLASEPISGLEHWFSDGKFQDALSHAGNNSGFTQSLRNSSDSRRIMYSGMFVETDLSTLCKAEVTLSGIKYPRPTFDMNIRLYRSGELEADIFLSELLLRSPWKIVDSNSSQLDLSLKELVTLGSMLLTSFKLS